MNARRLVDSTQLVTDEQILELLLEHDPDAVHDHPRLIAQVRALIDAEIANANAKRAKA